MRKQAPKPVSSVPPAERSQAGFREDLKGFLAGGRGLLLLLVSAFSKDEAKKAKKWVKGIVNDASDSFRHLYFQYGILPSSVLNILAECKVVDSARDATWDKIRSCRLRDADAQVLEKAAGLVEQWEPFVPPAVMATPYDADGIYPSSVQLRRIARDIRELGPAQRHRPKEVDLAIFARELASLFRRITQRPLYKYVGRLLVTAFPKKWNPAGDIREAAKKLVKKRLLGTDIDFLSDYTTSRTGISPLLQGYTEKTKIPRRPRKVRAA